MAATDFFATVGIALALCAAWLRVYGIFDSQSLVRSTLIKGITLAFFVVLLVPMPGIGIALAAFFRGFSADLSITLVALSVLSLLYSLYGMAVLKERELNLLMWTVAAAAVLLYPSALGWGDWDAYRLGWGSALGSWLLWLGLALICVVSWFTGLRVLPAMVALGLLAWSFGLLESGNLWDYLLDPWLSVFALGFVFIKCTRTVFYSFR